MGEGESSATLDQRNVRRYQWSRSPWVGIVLLLATVAIFLVLTGDAYKPDAAANVRAAPSVVDFEFAGTHERVEQIYGDWDDATEDRVVDALALDYAFIVAYALFLGWGCLDGAVVFRTSRMRAFAYVITMGVAIAAVCDWLENWALFNVHDAHEEGRDTGRAAAWALAATVPKWLILAIAIPVGTPASRSASLAAGTSPVASSSPRPRHKTHPAVPLEWRRNYAMPSVPRRPSDPNEPSLGICFSGGGIRSASFALGALQELHRRTPGCPSIYESAQYVSSVSGGGYLASAYQMLAHTTPSPVDPPPFAPGTAEEDHIRRHGRYLADSVGEWAIAITRVLVGLLLNLGLIYLVLFVLSRPIGYLQRYLFWSRDVDRLVVEIPSGVWNSIGVFAALALAFIITAILGGWATDAQVPTKKGYLWRVGAAFGALSFTMLLILVIFPLLTKAVWIAVEWVGNLGDGDDASSDDRLSGLTAFAAVLGTGTAVSSVVAVRGRSKRSLAKLAGKTGSFVSGAARYSGWFSRLAPKLAGVLLGIIALIILASLSHDAARRGPDATPSNLFGIWTTDDVRLWLAIGALLALLWLLADQTTWSLHPLYKRRLASAFAIERVGDGARELPYDVRTKMSDFMKPPPDRPLPQLVVCAAANLSGSQLAPPGRRAVPFTFEYDYVGGPELGYIETPNFEDDLLGGRMKADGTLLAATAVSGAAFASAMGRQSRGAVNSLLAVFNARLGVWLPNPRVPQPEHGNSVTRWFRETRRFSYLVKEIFGVYRPDDRFVYVTDGGHWENLGLVELLRRRCEFVFCFDASGGGPAFCTTLAEALLLAQEELGVEFDFGDELEEIAPGTVAVPEQGNVDRNRLLRRSAKSAVAVGRFTYLDTGVNGVIVYAKAVLTKDTPPGVLAHAASGRGVLFPDDSTGDQFFDQDQFGAYKELGRHIARAAVAAAQQPGLVGVPTAVRRAPT